MSEKRDELVKAAAEKDRARREAYRIFSKALKAKQVAFRVWDETYKPCDDAHKALEDYDEQTRESGER